MTWVGKRPRGQNLYSKEQKRTTEEYRKNYDAIRWDTYEKNTNHESPQDEDNNEDGT